MRVLFLHNNFPAQYRHLAAALAADPGNQVVFATRRAEGNLAGVRKLLFQPTRAPRQQTHPYLRGSEGAVLNGQAVYRLCAGLKREGFVPDLICGHSGWGPSLFVKDAFPDVPLLCYFEWYYRSRGSDSDFLDGELGPDEACRIRMRNAPILLDLAHCDWGITPTAFQQAQFPAQFRSRLSVLHDGIDTGFFRPTVSAAPALPGCRIAAGSEIVTYATRGMEPYRGFPQFMRAVALLQRRRPGLHVVVAGQDRVAYGQPLPAGESYRQKLLAELPELDLQRLHFTGLLPYQDYLRLLQASSAHVYLTVPFVLSWSLLEALSTGCLVVASDTAPVREVISHGDNGLLVDFFSPEAIAEAITAALDGQVDVAAIRRRARAGVIARYALGDLLPRQLKLMEDVAAGRQPKPSAPLRRQAVRSGSPAAPRRPAPARSGGR